MIKELFRKIGFNKPKQKRKNVLVKKEVPLWEKASAPLAKKLYSEGEHSKLALILPHIKESVDPFVQALMSSRLLTMGEELTPNLPPLPRATHPISLGGDPEFILVDKKGDIVLFSSKHSLRNIVMSQATIGADYGLMEFRLQPSYNVDAMLNTLDSLMQQFDESYKDIFIHKREAVVFNHKIARTREQIEDDTVDFGVNITKDNSPINEINLDDETSYMNMTLSAYDEPTFGPVDDNLLTAGGHIHIGGTFVRMLSLEQVKAYVRCIDKLIFPICQAIETPAAKLRRTMYGKPGEFRLKPYGLEYRTPSNTIFWPENNNKLKEILTIMVDEAKTSLYKQEIQQ